MQTLSGKVAVVTGASSGIGRELATALAAEGCCLAIADINKDGLEETAQFVRQKGATVTTHNVDVSERDQVYAFAQDVIEKYRKVQLVINNAGVALLETVEDVTYEDFEWIMRINFWGVVYGTKAFLPHLKEQPEAHLVNLSSAYGLIAIPTQSTYCATKFAIRGFTEALRRELRDSSVTVSCVHPGGVKTNIAKNARFYKFIDGSTDRNRFIKIFDKKMARMDAREAAKVIIQGIKKNRERILVGSDARIIDIVQRLFPSVYDKVFSIIY